MIDDLQFRFLPVEHHGDALLPVFLVWKLKLKFAMHPELFIANAPVILQEKIIWKQMKQHD